MHLALQVASGRSTIIEDTSYLRCAAATSAPKIGRMVGTLGTVARKVNVRKAAPCHVGNVAGTVNFEDTLRSCLPAAK